MNPKTMENASKIVKAAMKVLYAPETRPILGKAVQSVASQDPRAIAINAVGVVKILFDKSGGKMPPDSIPIATTIIVYEIASFASEATGEPIPPEVVKEAIPVAMELLKKTFAKQIEAAKGGQQPAPQGQPPQGGMLQQQQPQMIGA
jgi:hypothetical protein